MHLHMHWTNNLFFIIPDSYERTTSHTHYVGLVRHTCRSVPVQNIFVFKIKIMKIFFVFDTLYTVKESGYSNCRLRLQVIFCLLLQLPLLLLLSSLNVSVKTGYIFDWFNKHLLLATRQCASWSFRTKHGMRYY